MFLYSLGVIFIYLKGFIIGRDALVNMLVVTNKKRLQILKAISMKINNIDKIASNTVFNILNIFNN